MPEHNPIKEGDSSLTPKQRAFVQAYQENPTENGARAVIKAGYDVSTNESARVIASQNLRKPSIKREIVRIMEEQGLTDEYLTQRLKRGVEEEDPKAYLQAIKIAHDLKGSWAPTKQEVQQEGNMVVRWATKEELEKGINEDD